ncbi:MAG: ribosome biogenesis GTPase Der [Gammaproteobacteria bacterium]|nr:ribosome biogenesis GTPase Der [Gammaproteobacteria bacterium]
MLPVIALVGRPNVGKSTLFNRLTGTRDALVADYPGLTRDRLYGFASLGDGGAIVIDTGGLTVSAAGLDQDMSRQVGLAVAEADVVIVLVDGFDGVTPDDARVVDLIRRSGKNAVLAVNKSEGQPPAEAVAEFFALGLGEPEAISATRGDGVDRLLDRVSELLPADLLADARRPELTGTRIAVVGRPNVGKSTLINRFLGEERLITQDEAGTTRDSIAVPFSLDERDYVLVDTAGIRRRARVEQMVEKFTIVKSLQAVEEADAVIVLVDAREGVTEQDVSLIGLILERGRALTLGVNKWDGLPESRRAEIRRELDRRLPFLDFIDVHYVSAKHGSNIVDLLRSAARAAQAALRELPTPRLNDVLQAAVQAHPPPVVRRSRVKLSYAHQGGRRPPVIVIHGNQTARLPGSYRRYLVNCFRKAFRLKGTPIRLQLRTGANPFAGRRNKLTPRQQRRRQRVRRHGRR